MLLRNTRLIAFAVALAAVHATSDAEAADPAPGQHSQAYLIGGTLLFAVPYIASDVVGLTYSIGRNVSCSIDSGVDVAAIAGASTQKCPNRGYGWLTVPFAGPFISLAAYPQGTAAAVALVADSAAQIAGATLFIIGLVRREDHASARTATWDLVPGAPGSLAGLALRIRGL